MLISILGEILHGFLRPWSSVNLKLKFIKDKYAQYKLTVEKCLL